MNYKEHYTNKFARTTFVGFIIGVVVIYLKPELQNTVMFMYAVLGGKNAVESYGQTKLPKKE